MYLFLKTLHLIAVVAFLGNISVGIFWKTVADRSGSPAIMAHTIKNIMLADRLITIPSIIVLFFAGLAAAMNGHLPILHTGWILWSLVLFIISGTAFGPLSRTQVRMTAAAQEMGANPSAAVRYEQLSRTWNVLGLVALGAPVIALVLMVLKPELPALH